jgi:hypothetical protein
MKKSTRYSLQLQNCTDAGTDEGTDEGRDEGTDEGTLADVIRVHVSFGCTESLKC